LAAAGNGKITEEQTMNSTTDALLPKQFANLAPHLRYALPTTKERVRARVNSSMAELQAFYDDVGPRMEGIMTYLQDFPPEESKLAPQELRLVKLAKAFMAIAPALELFHAPDEPNVWGFEDMTMDDRVVTPCRT
jgi:hypothetical protein